ncbi:MAG: MinD/ParA family protein [Steroidobacteraceae bacterium]
MARRPVQVVAVTGGKGGVGKTNVSANLGIALARLGRRVMLLDADLGLANLDVLLGLRSQGTLAEVLDGERSLDEILVNGPSGVTVVPGASGMRRLAALDARQQAGLVSAFGGLARDVDALIVDTAAGIGDPVLGFCQAAQRVLVVVCDEPTAMTDAYALVKVLSRECGVRDFDVLANMTRSAEEGPDLHRKLLRVTDRFLDVRLGYAGAIPHDERLREAVRRQESVLEAYPGSPAARAFDTLARRVAGWPVPEHPRGHVEFFVERLLAASRSPRKLQ